MCRTQTPLAQYNGHKSSLPSEPPKKIPKNCDVEYTPIAVPLLYAGAVLEIKEGRACFQQRKGCKKNK